MTGPKKLFTALVKKGDDHRFGVEVSGLDAGHRGARHGLVLITAPLLAIVISVFVLGGIASAHVVTSITADCYQVTAYFSDFPDSGVMVRIAADVNGQTVSSDVLVTSATTEAQLDISAATATLADTPAHIDVDVTWTYLGPQHAHESFTLVCGTATSTSVAQVVTTTTAAVPATTTTQVPATTTGQSTTSTQVHGTTIVATTTAPATTTTETIRRLGTTVVATTTTVPAIATLPRTGSNPVFPLLFGASSLIAGALLLVRQRRTTGGTNEDWGSAT